MSEKVEKTNGVFIDTPTTKEEDSILWRGFKVTFDFIYETPAMVVGLIAGGIAAQIFLPSLAITCYSLAFASLGSKILIKVLGRFQVKWLREFEEWAWNLKKKIPYIQTIFVVSSLVIGFIIPILGLASSLAVGLYNGIIFEIEYYKQLRVLHQVQVTEEVHNSELLQIL